VKRAARRRVWSPPRSAFAGFRFPADVIVIAVRWYLRYGLSYRDVEELLTERGVEVDHVTIYRWVQRFTPLLADAARYTRHAPGDRWFVDETYVKVNGIWRYVYRAIDQHGQVIDVLLHPAVDEDVVDIDRRAARAIPRHRDTRGRIQLSAHRFHDRLGRKVNAGNADRGPQERTCTRFTARRALIFDPSNAKALRGHGSSYSMIDGRIDVERLRRIATLIFFHLGC
jgi:hypothetical protein